MRSLLPLLILLGCNHDEDKDTGVPKPDLCDASVDLDGDGVSACDDCDDEDPSRSLSASESCWDGVDNDCDELIDTEDAVDCPPGEGEGEGEGECETDADGDTHCAEVDCDDDEPSTHPEADELCDGIDNDCDGETDEAPSGEEVEPARLGAELFYQDEDGDAFGDAEEAVWACSPPEGYVSDSTDCDDARVDVCPSCTEVCDDEDIDEDCDGASDDADVDIDDSVRLYADRDGDGYGSEVEGEWDESHCDPFDYFIKGNTDCLDSDATAYPGGIEVCDGVDNDCDGEVDPPTSVGASTWNLDEDGDTFGVESGAIVQCTQPEGFVPAASPDWLDCDDGDASVYPDANEHCDGIDHDCDTLTFEDDSEDATTWYADADADTYGDPAVEAKACEAPSGYLARAADCDDGREDVFPGAPEYCDGIDHDCDTLVFEDDSEDATTWYYDQDADDCGSARETTTACSKPTDYLEEAGDCDDTNPAVCERRVFYLDADLDGYGDEDASETRICATSYDGYATSKLDCDDADPKVNPAQSETCDGKDNDCDDRMDDEDTDTLISGMPTWYPDSDLDGYGDKDVTSGATKVQCESPGTEYSSSATDCNDADAAIHPAMDDTTCDGVDNDCSGAADDNVSSSSMPRWYLDSDGDDYGDPSSYKRSCDAPDGYVSDNDDCDDSDEEINPGATETCDGFDEDCGGTPDTSTVCEDETTALGKACQWDSRSGHAYLFCTTWTTYWEALDFCDAIPGYHLATINDESEQAWMWGKASALSTEDWFIGAYEGAEGWSWYAQATMTGDYECAGAVDMDYTDWTAARSAMDCGVLYKNGTTDGGWGDSECGADDDRPFICESCSGY